MAQPDDVTAALAEIANRPYYQLARTFSDEELMGAITAGNEMGITAPDVPSVLTAETVHEHGAYWAQIVNLAQMMFR